MRKLVIILVQALLFMQFINALPTPSETDELNDEEKLILKGHNTYVDFFSYASEKYGELFQEVLKELKTTSETNEELKTALKPFEDFVSRAVDLKSKSTRALQELFNESTKLANKYDKGVPLSASDADQQIAKSMENAHAMKTKFDILMKYLTSLQQFGNGVRKFLNSLSIEEREKNQKLLNWYENWQNEDDFTKKSELMIEFFDLYDAPKTDQERMVETVMITCLKYLDAVIDLRKDVYKKVEKAIEKEFPTPDESVKFQLDIFKGYKDRAGKVHDLKGMDAISETMRLYAAGQEIATKYSSKDLSDDEKKIAMLLEANGNMQLEVHLAMLTFDLNGKLTRTVEKYLDSLSKDKKEKEWKLTKWLEDVQDETDYSKISDKLLEVIGNFEF